MIKRKQLAHKYFLYLPLLLIFIGGCVQTNPNPHFTGFELKNLQEDKVKTIYTFEGGNNNLRLEIIKKIDEGSAKNIIEGEVLTLEALYGNALSPYPGVISDEIICDGKYVPKKQEIKYKDQEIIYMVAYLSERLTYGACTEDLSKYKGVIAWSYCKNKEEYRQLEFISPKDEFENNSINFLKENICN